MRKIMNIIFGLALFLCVSFPVLASADQDDKITIGVSVYSLDDAEVRAFRNYLEDYIGITFDVEFLYSSGMFTAEEEISFISELHERGVKGIISFLSSDLEQVLPVCEEYGMYYVRGSGTISNSMYEKVKNNPYFLGTIGPSVETEIKAAADMAEYFASKDEEHQNHYVITCGGAGRGNEMHRLRTIGILNKLKDVYGLSYDKSPEDLVQINDAETIETGSDIKIVLVPGYSDEDNLTENLGNLLDTGEYNAVLSVWSVSGFISTIEAIEEKNGKDILVGAIDCFTENTYELFNSKGYGDKEKLDYLVGKYGAIVAPSFAAMMNAYDGYAEDYRENGCAFQLDQSFWTASSAEEFNKQYALSIGMYDNTYSAVDMMEVMEAYTPDADFEAFKKFVEK